MLHIIQNDPEVPPGTITDHITIPCRLWHPCKDGELPPVAGMKALIVLGGAMGANDDSSYPFLTGLKELIRTVVAAGIPYLGVCLGGQLLAAALGAQVVSNRWEEIGNFTAFLTDEGGRDPLFTGIPPEFPAFQWHHDSFDIPEGGVLLASSPACPHQAFRVGTSAWGIQFHPEVTEDIIRCWCGWDKAQAAVVDRHLDKFAAAAAGYQQVIQALLASFEKIVAADS